MCNINNRHSKPLSAVLKLFPLIVYCCVISSGADAQFREVYRGTDSTNHIYGISFTTPSTGYVAFSKYIGFTQDSGRTFIQRKVSYVNTDFNGYPVGLTFGFTPAGIMAFSADSLLVYGDFSFEPSILFSSNGGQSWKLVFHRGLNVNAPVFSDGVTDMEFPGNGAVGYAVHHEQILKTTNRGQTWTAVFNAPSHLLRKLSCPSTTNCYASGGNKIYKTMNGGAAWTNIAPQVSNTSQHFNNVYFTSNTTGYSTESRSSQIYKTIDGGLSWTKMNEESVVPTGGNDLYFVNDSTGFLATYGYQVAKTTDHGKTWEICKKNTPYQYKYYGMNALFFLNNATAWAGGEGEYLLLTTDGGTATMPKAYFKIDTTNIINTNTVNLVNYSKPGYQYSWYKNGMLISNAYNTSYTHQSTVLRDTVQLVVQNNTDSDTLELYVDFRPPVIITSYNPTVGFPNREIIITGSNFGDATSVSFGGVPAAYFQVRSGTEIYAVVGNGASGDVKITTSTTSGSKSGFVFMAYPVVNLPTTIADSILCKSEPVTITIQNTEADVRYELLDGNNKSFGYVKGNGGQVTFVSTPITVTGDYYFKATRSYLTTTLTWPFSNKIHVAVEHTRSVLSANKVNVEPGELVNYYNYSLEAASFAWKFYQDASIGQSSDSHPNNVFYNSPGQKTVSLISTSENGCADTLVADGVSLYNKPVPEDVCYANNTGDNDTYELNGSLNDMTKCQDDGYLLCGSGNYPLLKSRYGVPKKINAMYTYYCARYTKDGVLKWATYVTAGQINSAASDEQGNIYMTGICNSSSFFHLNNGDSLSFYIATSELQPVWSKDHGFIIKFDVNGNYLWHTLLYDPTPRYQGYQVQGGIGTKIRIQGGQIIVLGSCIANLSYYRQGVTTPMLALPNSTSPRDNLNNFIVSIKSDGTYLWSSYHHHNANNQLRALTDVGVDNQGNCYVTGYYEFWVEIHDALNTLTTLRAPTNTVGDYHGFILKYNKEGRLLWNVHLDNEFDFNKSTLNAIAVDTAGNSYVTGSSSLNNNSQYIVINNANGTTKKFSLAAYFLLKFNPDGINIWAQGSRYSYYGAGMSVCLDSNTIYATGVLYNNGVSFSSFTMTSGNDDKYNFPIYGTEFFLAQYDTSGVLKKLNTSGRNNGGHLSATRLAIDSKKQVLLGGITDPYNGGNSSHQVFGSTIYPDRQDAFYAKLSPDLCTNAGTPLQPDAGRDTSICAGETVTLGRPVAGITYSWNTVDGSFSSFSPAITVTPTKTTSYVMSLLNASGIITSDTVIVRVNTPIVDAGADKTICPGSSINIGSQGTGDMYAWTSAPAGFTSQSPNPVINPLVTTIYYLSVVNGAGCKAYDTILVTVRPPTANAGPDTIICSGSTVTIGGQNDGTAYSWTSEPAGFTSQAPHPVVAPAVTTQYYLSVHYDATCKANDTILVAVKITPAKPTITKGNDNTLVSSASTSNQWYVDTTTAIAGAIQQSYKPVVDGLYSVQVTENGCKSPFADKFDYKIITAVDDPAGNNAQAGIYPNPARDLMTVQYNIWGVRRINVSIYDSRGRLILTKKNIASGDQLSVYSLSQGFYIMKLYDDQNKIILSRQLIKL
jgi:photosystem II stability/assembly factor-like uncharacterized protein